MYFVSPDYINILLTHPFGPPMLAGAALSLILGHFVIRQIVNIKV